MDLEQVQRLAQAFAQGVAFARGFTEMAQDAKDGEEDGHWVTIGAEAGPDGEKHGGRPVFISGSGTIKKGLSKSAQGKTLGQVFGKGGEFSSEGKKSGKGETAREAGLRMQRAGKEAGERARTQRARTGTKPANAGVLAEKGKALADLVKKEYGKVESKIRQDFEQTHKDIDKFSDPVYKIPGVNFSAEVRIKSGLNTIKTYTETLAEQINMTAQEVARAAEHDDFNRAGVENVWIKIKQLEKKSKNLAGRTDTAMHGLGWMSTNGHEDAARDITKLKDEAIKLYRESYDLYNEAIDAIRQYSRSRQE